LAELVTKENGGFAVADLSREHPADGVTRSLDQLITASTGLFDIVVIDAASRGSGVDSLLAIRACTHVVLVAAAGSLSWEPLDRLCSDLESERVELVGCVLNRYKRGLPGFLNEMLR
jgi:Mrp family chromosome partitioning ATPase